MEVRTPQPVEADSWQIGLIIFPSSPVPAMEQLSLLRAVSQAKEDGGSLPTCGERLGSMCCC